MYALPTSKPLAGGVSPQPRMESEEALSRVKFTPYCVRGPMPASLTWALL